jgi:hypothetical protein
LVRPKTVLVVIVVAALLIAATVQASYPKPPTGPWSIAPGSGFTLKNGKGGKKGTVFLSDFHFKIPGAEPCEGAPNATKVKVLGSFPLKQFHRGGYTAWGVGKNVGGEPGYAPVKVSAEGKTLDGELYLTWNYEDVTRLIRGAIAIGNCSYEFFTGAPK